MIDEEQAKLKIARARIQVLLKNPFFGALVMFLPMKYEESVARADTDGEIMYYNPYWINNLSEQEIAAAICHTVLHCALGHLWRRSARDLQHWDRACDLVVNSILSDEGYLLPAKLEADQTYRLKSAEEVYNLIWDGTKPEQRATRMDKVRSGGDQLGGQGSNAPGEDLELNQLDQHDKWSSASRSSQAKAAELERLWKERVARALQSARGRGELSEALERCIGEFLQPEKDWRQVLAEFLIKLRSDYSWLPPDRRLVTYRILIPDLGLEEERLEHLVIAVDTSGSIERDQLQRFLSEVRGIVASFNTIQGHLVFCDSEIKSWTSLLEFTEVVPKGGGGTDTRPIFEEINRRGINPSALVYLTDGITVYPDYEPAYPVLWVLTKGHALPPWGRKIVLKTI